MGLKIGSGIPCFSKVWFKPLHFYKRPILVPVFANNNNNKKNPKRIFNFYKKKKKKKWKQHSVCFQQLLMEASSSSEQWVWPGKLLSWELHSASQQQVARALNDVHEHLCFLSIYLVHLLARGLLRYGFFKTFQLMDNFIGPLHF